jgi:hypothetical protein
MHHLSVATQHQRCFFFFLFQCSPVADRVSPKVHSPHLSCKQVRYGNMPLAPTVCTAAVADHRRGCTADTLAAKKHSKEKKKKNNTKTTLGESAILQKLTTVADRIFSIAVQSVPQRVSVVACPACPEGKKKTVICAPFLSLISLADCIWAYCRMYGDSRRSRQSVSKTVASKFS